MSGANNSFCAKSIAIIIIPFYVCVYGIGQQHNQTNNTAHCDAICNTHI